MLFGRVLHAFFPILLLIGVYGVLPPKKRPYLLDTAQETHSESQAESTSHPIEPIGYAELFEDSASRIFDEPEDVSQAALLISGQRTTGIVKKRRLTAKESAHHARLKEEAFNKHRDTALRLKGLNLEQVDSADKVNVKKARSYFHNTATKARQLGDYDLLTQVTELVRILPTPFISRHPPAGQKTPELEERLKKARIVRESRERKQANVFMEKEFGIPAPLTKKGPKFKDISQMYPEKARKLALRRKHYPNAKRRNGENDASSY